MSKKLLEIRNLTMKFGGVVALSEVNLHVSEGEIAALIGPNGAGKTTLISMITGMFEPDHGNAWIGGYDIKTNISKAQL